jgi:hypothetical protein
MSFTYYSQPDYYDNQEAYEHRWHHDDWLWEAPIVIGAYFELDVNSDPGNCWYYGYEGGPHIGRSAFYQTIYNAPVTYYRNGQRMTSIYSVAPPQQAMAPRQNWAGYDKAASQYGQRRSDPYGHFSQHPQIAMAVAVRNNQTIAVASHSFGGSRVASNGGGFTVNNGSRPTQGYSPGAVTPNTRHIAVSPAIATRNSGANHAAEVRTGSHTASRPPGHAGAVRSASHTARRPPGHAGAVRSASHTARRPPGHAIAASPAHRSSFGAKSASASRPSRGNAVKQHNQAANRAGRSSVAHVGQATGHRSAEASHASFAQHNAPAQHRAARQQAPAQRPRSAQNGGQRYQSHNAPSQQQHLYAHVRQPQQSAPRQQSQPRQQSTPRQSQPASRPSGGGQGGGGRGGSSSDDHKP